MKNCRAINLSVLIPAFDENKNLSILLPKIRSEVKVKNFEVVVVDGYFYDRKTYSVCKKNNVFYCRRKNNNSTTIILNFFSDIFKILNAYNRNMFFVHFTRNSIPLKTINSNLIYKC